MSDLETETTTPDGTTTFEHFGRTWTVPVKRQHSHLRHIKQIIRTEGSVDVDDICLIYLPDEEYDALVALDVDVDELGEFADHVSKTIGLGDAGNS